MAATPDVRHLTKYYVNYVVPSRIKVESLSPLCIINDIPIDLNNPDTRLGTQCTLKNSEIRFYFVYQGTNPFKVLNFYVILKKVKENVDDPDPTLDKIMDTVDTNAANQPITKQIPSTSFMKINSSTGYSLLIEQTVTFNDENRGCIGQFVYDLNNLIATYSNEPVNDPETELNLKKALLNNLYIYILADPENPAITDSPTNVLATVSYRLCYNA